jgi:hypothetical protein
LVDVEVLDLLKALRHDSWCEGGAPVKLLPGRFIDAKSDLNESEYLGRIQGAKVGVLVEEKREFEVVFWCRAR